MQISPPYFARIGEICKRALSGCPPGANPKTVAQTLEPSATYLYHPPIVNRPNQEEQFLSIASDLPIDKRSVNQQPKERSTIDVHLRPLTVGKLLRSNRDLFLGLLLDVPPIPRVLIMN